MHWFSSYTISIFCMSPIVNEIITKISTCEIDAVKDANNWKFIKNDKKPKMIKQNVYICF
jgi:hypothetical protein